MYFCLFLMIILSCNNDDQPSPNYKVGKNRFTLQIQGDTREYYVHVPAAYSPSESVPMVFMMHGTSGDGEKFYDNSGWKEVGEAENILTVFPSSWHYCIIDDDTGLANTTKWNIYRGGFTYCSGETPRDDIQFIRMIIDDLNERFSIDNKRIYVVGFSNGGQMSGRCAVEMGDVFAAACANGGFLPADTVVPIIRNLPMLYQVGNKDDRYLPDTVSEISMDAFNEILDTTTFIQRQIQTYLSSFGIDNSYIVQGSEATQLVASYPVAPSSPERVFHFSLVKDMFHVYPNGENHWMEGAVIQWEWMSQFSLP